MNKRRHALSGFVLALLVGASGFLAGEMPWSRPHEVRPVSAAAILRARERAESDEPALEVAPGPRGGPFFCLAPPAPPKRDMPAWREPAPALDPARLGVRGRSPRGAAADTAKILVVLAEFADVPFDTARIDTTGMGAGDPADVLVRYFRRQFSFVGQYYAAVSYGRHVFSPTVLDTVIRLPARMSYYGDDDRFGERGTKLIWDAVVRADPLVDFGDYTGMAILHSGAGQESDISSNSEDQIWSAHFPEALLSAVLTDSLGRPVPGIPTQDLSAEGDTVFVRGSALIPELESQDGFNFGTMGVYTHEIGHVQAGWPDLYDTTAEDPSQGLGAFCLMAAGTWNGNGFVPGEASEWCRLYAGWLDPVTIDPTLLPAEGATFRVKEIEKDHPAGNDTLALRIPITADEYLLVTCRQPDPNDNRRFDWAQADTTRPSFDFWKDSFADAEFDYFTPNIIPSSPRSIYREAEGLYLWHIDESVVRFGFPYNLVNADPHHYGIDLEEADGVQDLEFAIYTLLSFGSPDDAFREGNATELSPWSTPSSASSFGAPTGIVISDVSAADSVMSFHLRLARPEEMSAGAVVAPGWPVPLAEPPGASEPLAADLTGDGHAELAVLGEGGGISVFTRAGARLTPADLTLGETPAGSPLAGNVDGDDAEELVVVGRLGRIRTFELTGGTLNEGAGGDIDSVGAVEGTLANVDGDLALELIVGSADAGPDSTQGKIWVVQLDGITSAESFAVSGPLAGGPTVQASPNGAIAVQAGLVGGLYGVRLAAATPARLPARAADPSIVFAQPVVADLDRDGRAEVLATGDDGRVHGWRLVDDEPVSFEPLPGWPVAVGGPIGGGVSVADVDADGLGDVLVIGTSGAVYVLNYNGVPKEGYPKRLDVPQDTYYDLSPPHAAPLAADVTGDGALDLVAVFGDGRVLGLENSPVATRLLPGWPIDLGPGSVPVVGDFDGDGRSEVFGVESALDSHGDVLWTRATLWDLGSRYTPRPDAWVMHRRDGTRNTVLGTSRDPAQRDVAALRDVYCQPNPGSSSGTSVHYVPSGEVVRVDIAIYDASGVEVRRLAGSAFGGVDNLVRWDGKDGNGNPVSAGLYVYRVSTTGAGANATKVGKLAIVR